MLAFVTATAHSSVNGFDRKLSENAATAGAPSPPAANTSTGGTEPDQGWWRKFLMALLRALGAWTT